MDVAEIPRTFVFEIAFSIKIKKPFQKKGNGFLIGTTFKKEIMDKKIAIIGGGNLGSAIAEGLIKSRFISPQHIIITKRNITTLSDLEEKGVLVSNNNIEAAQYADWIILAVKPFQVKDILTEIKPYLKAEKHSLISVITGVWIKDLQEILNNDFTLFRAMPNTAIAIQQSITCVCSGKYQ